MRLNNQLARGSPGTTNSVKSQLIFLGVFIVIAAAVFVLFDWLTGGNFLEWTNIRIILASMIYPTFMAWGMCFLFACGFSDMSWGSVVVLASFGAGVFGNAFGFAGVILAGIIIGAVLVFFNFCIYTFTNIPTWIASISLALAYEAVSVYLRVGKITGQYVEAPLNDSLRVLGQFPWNLIVLFAGAIVVYFIYNRAKIGFYIRAIGGNVTIARSLGVNTVKTLLRVGIICGLLIGAAAVLQQSYNGYTTIKSGLSSIVLTFQPLAAALLADILQKKINVIIAVPICAFLMFAAFNLLSLLHVPSGTLQEALLALFLITFAVMGQRNVKGVVK